MLSNQMTGKENILIFTVSFTYGIIYWKDLTGFILGFANDNKNSFH